MLDSTKQFVEVSLSTGEKRLFHAGNLQLRCQAIGCNKDDVKALLEEGKTFCIPSAVFRLIDSNLDSALIQPAMGTGAWGFDI
jgi:hypothetical protein